MSKGHPSLPQQKLGRPPAVGVPGGPPRSGREAVLPKQPKPVGPPKMSAGQKMSRDARMGGKIPVNANQAIKAGALAGGHVHERHSGLSPGAMHDRLYGKDPGMAKADPKKQRSVVTTFLSKTQTNKAMNQVLRTPQGQAAMRAAARLPVGSLGKAVDVKIPKPMVQRVMQRPAAVKVGNKNVFPAGPANLTTQTTRKVTVVPVNTKKGPGLLTGYGTVKR